MPQHLCPTVFSKGKVFLVISLYLQEVHIESVMEGDDMKKQMLVSIASEGERGAN
jgi:hypothetical protein